MDYNLVRYLDDPRRSSNGEHSSRWTHDFVGNQDECAILVRELSRYDYWIYKIV